MSGSPRPGDRHERRVPPGRIEAAGDAAPDGRRRADLLHAIYDRIIVVGRFIVGARLTPAGLERPGLAPLQVVMARPPVLSAWE